ncbi:hypothetical protein ACFOSW_01525 [Paenibacillus sp. GCM10012303]
MLPITLAEIRWVTMAQYGAQDIKPEEGKTIWEKWCWYQEAGAERS